ncbi:hypothetical protein DEU40_12270 [Chryseobacterium sp. AG844]|nr:hypothetical protein DEU40_12270 [Chryseobacterium sp. AG844]
MLLYFNNVYKFHEYDNQNDIYEYEKVMTLVICYPAYIIDTIQ